MLAPEIAITKRLRGKFVQSVPCMECTFVGPNRLSLSQHVRAAHGGSREYYDRHPRACVVCKKAMPFSRKWMTRVCCDGRCLLEHRRQMWTGEKSKNWKGGRTISPDQGYAFLDLRILGPSDLLLATPMARTSGKSRLIVAEHRLVMARGLGRPLTKAETVHHINGARADNRRENLELWAGKHPPGIRAGEISCPCCGYTFDRYMAARKNDPTAA